MALKTRIIYNLEKRPTPPLSPTFPNEGMVVKHQNSTEVTENDNGETRRCMDCERETWKTKRYTSVGMNTEISINPSEEIDSLRSNHPSHGYTPPNPQKNPENIFPVQVRNPRGRPPLHRNGPVNRPPGSIIYTTVDQEKYMVSTLPLRIPHSHYEGEYIDRMTTKHNHRTFSPQPQMPKDPHTTKIRYPIKGNAIDLDMVPYENSHSKLYPYLLREKSPPVRAKHENGYISPPRHNEQSHSPPHHQNIYKEEYYSRVIESRHSHPHQHYSHVQNSRYSPVYDPHKTTVETRSNEDQCEREPPVFVLPNDFDHKSDIIDPDVMDYPHRKDVPMETTNGHQSSDGDKSSPTSSLAESDTSKPPASIQTVPQDGSVKVCKICDKTFPTKSTLYKHLRGHSSDEKPYKCNECGQGFTLSSNLRQHRIIHRGYKPFRCEFCGKCFMRSNVYKQHRRSHTGEQMHKCDYCPSEFLQRYALIKHLKKVHNIDHIDH